MYKKLAVAPQRRRRRPQRQRDAAQAQAAIVILRDASVNMVASCQLQCVLLKDKGWFLPTQDNINYSCDACILAVYERNVSLCAVMNICR